jgi:GT2 family glycosyltransferase
MQLGLQLLVTAGGSYFALLTAATFLRRESASKISTVEPRFAVVVPAHDEEQTISSTLRSLELLDYAPDRYEVFVVADNCKDSTAEVARRFRCTVWERMDPERKAKGYALSWAFERIPEEYDAIVVVDADTRVDPQLLAGFARAHQLSTALQALNLQFSGSNAGSTARPDLSQRTSSRRALGMHMPVPPSPTEHPRFSRPHLRPFCSAEAT